MYNGAMHITLYFLWDTLAAFPLLISIVDSVMTGTCKRIYANQRCHGVIYFGHVDLIMLAIITQDHMKLAFFVMEVIMTATMDVFSLTGILESSSIMWIRFSRLLLLHLMERK